MEDSAGKNGKVEYQCKTCDVVAKMKEHIETDECVDACGVDRNFVGISSDSLLEPQFAAKLCSPACYKHCDNIVDLYFNLAAGEDLYNKQKNGPHRAMVELSSNGAAAEDVAYAPAPYYPDFFNY